MKKYSFDDHPDDRLRLPEFRDRWIAHAMSTAPIAPHHAQIVEHLRGLYDAAKQPWHGRVVFVDSPLITRFAGGFAAGLWYRRQQGTPCVHTEMTGNAAYDAAVAAVGPPGVSVITRPRVDGKATNWYAGVPDMALASDRLGLGKFGLDCAVQAWQMWQGGNQWASWCASLEFFRHVAKLEIDWEPWSHWARLAEISGPRIMHAEFCIVSDRPELLTVDADHRPHNEDGPFGKWRDGFRLYSTHGVRLPGWIVEHPERITVALINGEQNAEIRQIMVDRYGVGRYMLDSGSAVIHECIDEVGQPLRPVMTLDAIDAASAATAAAIEKIVRSTRDRS